MELTPCSLENLCPFELNGDWTGYELGQTQERCRFQSMQLPFFTHPAMNISDHQGGQM